MAIKQLIRQAFLKIGAISAKNDANASEYEDAKDQLNIMLYNWSVQKNAIFTSVYEDFSLVAGTGSYTWGSGGDFNSARPTRIIACNYRNQDIDYPIQKTTRENYMPIAQKDLESLPDYYLHEPAYPLATITFYPVPDSTYTVYFYSQKPLAQYSNVADDIALPPEYYRAIVYNLALELAPDYTEAVPPTVPVLAVSTMKDLKALHAQPVPQIKTSLESLHKYNIYKDS